MGIFSSRRRQVLHSAKFIFMEYRIALTLEEAFNLSRRLKVIRTSWLRDEYTGERRIRTQEDGTIIEKDYLTSVKGTVFRMSSFCEFKGVKNVWFEMKWTDKTSRFEVEFEGKVPDEFKGRSNVSGWDILSVV